MSLDAPASPADSVSNADSAAPAPESQLPPPPAIRRDADAPGEVSTDPENLPEEDGTPSALTRTQELSESLGLDLSGFTSEKDAEAAARLLIEKYAAAGLNTQYASPPANATPPVTPVESATPTPEGLPELDDVDPKLAEYLKRLTADAAKRDKELEALRQRETQYNEQVRRQQDFEIANRAHSAIDGWKDSQYGTTQTATFGQRIARRELMGAADSIINGMVANGQHVPPVERVLEMARLVVRPPVESSATAASPAVPPAPQGARAPLSPFKSTRSKTGVPNYNDPKDIAEARAVLARSRGG